MIRYQRGPSGWGGTKRPGHCPACGEQGPPVVYGLPGPEAVRMAQHGEIRLGGCCPPLLFDCCEECGNPLQGSDAWADPRPRNRGNDPRLDGQRGVSPRKERQ